MADRSILGLFLEARRVERERLSTILHDDVAGGLTAAGLALDLLAMDVPPDLQERVAEIQRSIERSFDAVRDLSREFHPDPAVRFRLAPALEMTANRFERRFRGRFRANLHSAALDAPEPAPEFARACLAVAELALDNVLRHASASEAELRFTGDGTSGTLLAVRDNGVGFNPARVTRKTGLAIMEYHVEVAGLELVVQSGHGSGTTVELVKRSTRREP